MRRHAVYLHHTYVHYISAKSEVKDTVRDVLLMENNNENNNERIDCYDAHQMILKDLTQLGCLEFSANKTSVSGPVP